MTFIASVAAKRGVAVIADSLVTSQQGVLSFNNYLNYIQRKAEETGDENVQINAHDLISLFRQEPSFTKDFEDKLLKINNYSCLTTCGSAYINSKSISTITEEFVYENNVRLNNQNDYISPDEIIEMVKSHFNNEISSHLQTGADLGNFVLILTHYDIVNKETTFKKIFTKYLPASDTEIGADYFSDFVSYGSVICDGQNKISDSILFGFSNDMYFKFADIVRIALDKLNINEDLLTTDILMDISSDQRFLDLAFSDMQIYNLNDLSLQQAIDLASLLMRIEVDFQKYTKNIPTVGGLIKLAVIDDEGFRFISGNELEVPRHLKR
ncbi:hypothetical protein G5B30_16770 [Sphingobacterium sp. SGG-5]|uniref:hypothetical protein n=1 Tax=Sphingobacterium sp. SGG-5 TaxID=2710881 RepID=UPI0013ECF40D|nr:hypothetical protein [Sphingobacterium sp. SGG-5]NGM63564.1 hypothetical protein [Sphingobacterium sp. SGG-5]